MDEIVTVDASMSQLDKERQELFAYLNGDVSRVRYHAQERATALERALADLPGDVLERDRRLANIDKDLHTARDELNDFSNWKYAKERNREEARIRVSQLDEALLISVQMMELGALTVPAPSIESDDRGLTAKFTDDDTIHVVESGKQPLRDYIQRGNLPNTMLIFVASALIIFIALLIVSSILDGFHHGFLFGDSKVYSWEHDAIPPLALIPALAYYAIQPPKPREPVVIFSQDNVTQFLDLHRTCEKLNGRRIGDNQRSAKLIASNTFTAMSKIAIEGNNESRHRLADWIVNYDKIVSPLRFKAGALNTQEIEVIVSMYGELLVLTRDPDAEREEMRQKLRKRRKSDEAAEAREQAERQRKADMERYLATHPKQGK